MLRRPSTVEHLDGKERRVETLSRTANTIMQPSKRSFVQAHTIYHGFASRFHLNALPPVNILAQESQSIVWYNTEIQSPLGAHPGDGPGNARVQQCR